MDQAISSNDDTDQEIEHTTTGAQIQNLVQGSSTADPSTAVNSKKGRKRKKKSIGLEVASSSNVTDGEAKAERKRERSNRER